MDRDHLIGPKMKSHRIFVEFQKEFPHQDELVVLVESGHQERNREFIERLAARVRPATNLFSDLFYKADFTTLGPKGLLLAPTQDLQELYQSLQEELPFIKEFTNATNLVSLFEQINTTFRTAPQEATPNTERLIKALPFLQRLVTEARQSMLRPGTPAPPEIEALFAPGPDAEQSIYVTLDRGRIYLLTVQPRQLEVTETAIERLRQFIRETEVEVPGVDVGLTGSLALDFDEMRQAEHDTTIASIAALLICSLIFIIAYRQLGRPLKAAGCLLIGLAYTMGFTTLVIGHLNILTITFAPMLIGLAIDFGIHFITRYEEEMRNGRSVVQAICRSSVFTGQGIVTGAFTTAAAFLAMALTRFKGIREMGIISGGGLLLCLVPMMTMLPVLLRRGRQNLRDRELGHIGEGRVRIETLWLEHSALVVAGTLVLCLLAVFQFPRVRFDYNLLHLQGKEEEAVRYEQKLLHAGGRAAIFAAVIADSPPQAEAYENRIKRLPSVETVESVADYFTEDQTRKLELVREIKRELAHIDFPPVDCRPVSRSELSATLWYLMGYLGLAATEAEKESPAIAAQLRSLRQAINSCRKGLLSESRHNENQLEAFQQSLFGALRAMFDALKSQDTSRPLRPQDLPPALRDRFIGVSGKYLIQVYPKKDIWDHANQEEFLGQLASVVPSDRVTGAPSEIYEYTTLLKVSYEQAAWYSLIAIALMIFLHFRSLLAVVLSLLPVAIGSVWLLGFMGLTGVTFNPANVMTVPLVVGIGVTNGIQILNRFAEERRPGIFAKSTGKAVLVSGLTAITGFGTLILAQHRGIRSLGEMMAVGIAACMIAGLTFLPALLCLLMGHGWVIEIPHSQTPAGQEY
jgi:hopanoid biosynthesis associated RND transporter like protein HpnN